MATTSAGAEQMHDPVCGMVVDLDGDGPELEHDGRVHRFCSQHWP